MRKREYDRVDKWVLDAIENWLQENDSAACPFNYYYGDPVIYCYICADLFPTLDILSSGCPCNTYCGEYVKWVAKRVVKKLGGKL